MLPSRHRMRSSSEFAATVRMGKRSGRRTVVVHVRVRETPTEPGAAEAGGEPSRIGFVVSKQVGNAVVRNRTRRRLRHVMCGQLPDLGVGLLIVVRALPAAATAGSAQLTRDLTGSLTSALASASRASVSAEADGSR